MAEDELKKIFSKNLNHLMDLNDKKPADLVNDLGIPFSTVADWIKGIKMPRSGKLMMLANYFRVEVTDLMREDAPDVPESYYLNDEAKEIAEFLFKNPEYKVLFDASRKVKPEDIGFVKEMMDRMRGSDPSD